MQCCRILLVDDEFIIRLTLAEAMSEAGYAVTEADTADAASSMLDAADGFDALVTDVQMPGRLDGVDLAENFRLCHPDAPILFMTGRPDALEAHGALLPSEHLLVKPFTPEEAIRTLRQALEDRDLHAASVALPPA